MISMSRGGSETSDEVFETPSDQSNKSTTPELEERPRAWIYWSPHLRQQLELTFTMQTNFPINGCWETTESYVKRKDEEMLQYINDFPLRKWIVPLEEALSAYKCLLERHRLRDNGHSIFINGRPAWWPLPSPIRQPKAFLGGSHRNNPLLASKNSVLGSSKNAAHTPLQVVTNASTMGAQKAMADISISTRRSGTFGKPGPYPMAHGPGQLLKSSVDPETITVNSHHDLIGAGVPNGDGTDMLPPAEDGRPRRGRPGIKPREESEMSPPLKTKVPRISKYSALKDVSPPPYAPRQRPSAVDRQPGPSVKAGRRESNLGFVKFYEKPEFPWHTEYAGEAAKAWDDSIYSQSRTAHLEAVQHRNAAIIAKHDLTKKAGDEDQEQVAQPIAPAVPEKSTKGKGKPKRRPAGAQAANFDPYHAGHLHFATDDDYNRCVSAGCMEIRDALQAAMRNPFDTRFAEVEVITDPGDRLIPHLEVPRVSVMDIARTRLQLEYCHVLPDLAAWRMIDFCPDMLFDYNLLKVIGETSAGNTLIQQRLATNGAFISGSTITKRVTSAVERTKEGESKSDKDVDKDWRAENRKEYNKYKSYHMARRARVNGADDPTTFDLAEAARLHIAGAPRSPSIRLSRSGSVVSSILTELESRQSSVEIGASTTPGLPNGDDNDLALAGGVAPASPFRQRSTRATTDGKMKPTDLPSTKPDETTHPVLATSIENKLPLATVSATLRNNKRTRTSDVEPTPASKRRDIRSYLLPAGKVA